MDCGPWHTDTAQLLADDDPLARRRGLANQVLGSASNAAAVRFFGTELLTVCVDLDDGGRCIEFITRGDNFRSNWPDGGAALKNVKISLYDIARNRIHGTYPAVDVGSCRLMSFRQDR